MRIGRLFLKLFLGNLLLMALVLVSCLWAISRELTRLQDQQLTRDLKVQAITLREVLAPLFETERVNELDQLVKRISREQPGQLRITLIGADGRVLADSETDPRLMELHDNREEVTEALATGYGETERRSLTLGGNLKYVAVPLRHGESSSGPPAGVVRVAMPMQTISEQAGTMHRLIWRVGLVTLVGAVILALGLAQLWSQPIRRIMLAARGLSRGNLSTKIRIGGKDELALLARSLDEMRLRLADQLETIDRQRRTLESLMAQLREGVVVANAHGRIEVINPAAVRLLGMAAGSSETVARFYGQAVEACIPPHELQQMLLARPDGLRRERDEAAGVREVRLQAPEGGPEVTVLARASDILLPTSEAADETAEPQRPPRPGRLLVLTDVSQLTRFLQVKADFAANASHELRTPLSAIRAALETLLHMDLAGEPEAGRRFIEVIERQSQRLELLVADLLELSRLESPRAEFRPAAVRLRELLDDIHHQQAERLGDKKLRWSTDIPADIDEIMTNPHLLRIVLDNLVDNAIKFTDEGGSIRITCRESALPAGNRRAVAITVEDTGAGIAPEEQDRVFERFYQVERARSGGTLRGTGLGLSIVRHAVTALKGTVELQSELQKGTRITVTIPWNMQAGS